MAAPEPGWETTPRRARRAPVGFLLWAAFELILSSIPQPALHATGPLPIDKIVHLGLYAIGGVLLTRWLVRTRGDRASALLLAAAGAAVLALAGALDELYQTLIPGRSGCDVGDWLADALGGALGSVVAGVWHRFRTRRCNVRSVVPGPGDTSMPLTGS